MIRSTHVFRGLAAFAMVVAGIIGFATAQQSVAQNMNSLTTTAFKGGKVNGGTATLSHDSSGKVILTLSDDFKTPDTPAPHWQVVDSKGNVYLLQRLQIKGDKFNKSITLPSYIHDVAKVQIWCAWAEALLGEASFNAPVM